jgi:hypothetical protein
LKVTVLETKESPLVHQIKQELTTLMSNRSRHLFTKMQKEQADIFGLEQFYRNDIPRNKLKNW